MTNQARYGIITSMNIRVIKEGRIQVQRITLRTYTDKYRVIELGCSPKVERIATIFCRRQENPLESIILRLWANADVENYTDLEAIPDQEEVDWTGWILGKFELMPDSRIIWCPLVEEVVEQNF